MIGLLVEDVTMLRHEQITLHLRESKEYHIAQSVRFLGALDNAESLSKIGELLDTNTFEEIAAILNTAGPVLARVNVLHPGTSLISRSSMHYGPALIGFAPAACFTRHEIVTALNVNPKP